MIQNLRCWRRSTHDCRTCRIFVQSDRVVEKQIRFAFVLMMKLIRSSCSQYSNKQNLSKHTRQSLVLIMQFCRNHCSIRKQNSHADLQIFWAMSRRKRFCSIDDIFTNFRFVNKFEREIIEIENSHDLFQKERRTFRIEIIDAITSDDNQIERKSSSFSRYDSEQNIKLTTQNVSKNLNRFFRASSSTTNNSNSFSIDEIKKFFKKRYEDDRSKNKYLKKKNSFLHIRFLETRCKKLNFKNFFSEIHDFVELKWIEHACFEKFNMHYQLRKNNFNSTKSWISLKRSLKFKTDKLRTIHKNRKNATHEKKYDISENDDIKQKNENSR